MRARREALVEECCTSDSNRGSLSPSFFTGFFFFFHLKLPLLSCPVNILPIFPGSAQTHCPMKPSWIYLSSCWVPKAVFISVVKDPSYPAPSFIHMQTAFLSSWGSRAGTPTPLIPLPTAGQAEVHQTNRQSLYFLTHSLDLCQKTDERHCMYKAK